MIRDSLRMCWQVVFHPNSAFATIRDNDRKYFPPSIGLILVVIISYGVLGSSLGDRYQIIENLGWAALSIVAYAGVVYLVGRVWGGNYNLRKVFTVMFYTSAADIAVAIVLVPVQLLIPFGASIPAVLIAAAWVLIIHIKAVKVVNGFGTAKAFAIVVLARVCFIALLILPYMVDSQTTFPGLIGDVSMWEKMTG